MLGEQKKLFKKWKLKLKDYWDFLIIFYKIGKRNINQKIYKKENIKEQISWFLIDVYFHYEYEHPLKIKEIGQLLLIEESGACKVIDDILNKIKSKSQKLFR